MADPALPLPPLREVIARHGLAARKGLGQHFLLDANLTGRIARAAGDLGSVTVYEVGPGPGGLTRSLLAAGAALVVAIERDRRCIAALAELAEAWPGRLRVIEGDALAVDPTETIAGPIRIVANLPYNIATPLLVGWLARPDAFEGMTLMFQKEVADRIVAAPGGRDYGRLAVLAQWHWRVERLFDIPPRAFVPPPRVTSTVVGFTPLAEPVAPARREALERVTAAAFGQRRKMLRAALRSLVTDTDALLAVAGIEPTRRAETVEVAGFCALARAWEAANRTSGRR